MWIIGPDPRRQQRSIRSRLALASRMALIPAWQYSSFALLETWLIIYCDTAIFMHRTKFLQPDVRRGTGRVPFSFGSDGQAPSVTDHGSSAEETSLFTVLDDDVCNFDFIGARPPCSRSQEPKIVVMLTGRHQLSCFPHEL